MTNDEPPPTGPPRAPDRSLLAVPASKLRMVEKALASEADAALLDLEDAVAPDDKADARGNVVRALTELDRHGKRGLYRVNPLGTPWFHHDLIDVVEGAGDALDAVMIPKLERLEDLYLVDGLLAQAELAAGLERGHVRLEILIESAAALVSVDAIARSGARLEGFHFGPGDYAASVGMPQTHIGTRDEWDDAYPGDRFHYPMQRIVVAARAAGLRAMDGPVADLGDDEGLRQSARRARSLGFDGKWCIHPKQIATVNEVFSPTDAELERASKLVKAYEESTAAGRGSIAVDGQMVDAASIRMAQALLDRARD